MSVTIVTTEHLHVLIWTGLQRQRPAGDLHWTYGNPSWRGILTSERATLTGQMLLDENVASYNHAYPDSTPYAAAPYTYQRPVHQSWSTPELLNALHAYRYNACERPEWATTEAAAFVDALQQRLISRIPGYREGPWCIGPESVPAASRARARA